MRANILMVVMAAWPSQETSPGEPPCRIFTAKNKKEVKISVEESQDKLDLWFNFQKSESGVNIIVKTTKGPQSEPFEVNRNKRLHTHQHDNRDSSENDDDEREDEYDSLCRVRMTQGSKEVKNSRLSVEGECGNTMKEREYTRDDVTELLVKSINSNKIRFNVCPVPPQTGTNCRKGNRTRGEASSPECTEQQTPAPGTTKPCPECTEQQTPAPGTTKSCPECTEQQTPAPGTTKSCTAQQLPQVATWVLGALLAASLLACAGLAAALCFTNNKGSSRGFPGRAAVHLTTSKQFLWPSRETNNQTANQSTNQTANQSANQGAMPGRRGSAHVSENSLYGATLANY